MNERSTGGVVKGQGSRNQVFLLGSKSLRKKYSEAITWSVCAFSYSLFSSLFLMMLALLFHVLFCVCV